MESNLIKLLYKKVDKNEEKEKTDDLRYMMLPVAVAESVTAGAVSTGICSIPGSSKFFKGGLVCYDISSKKDILKIDTVFSESHNFANPFTTIEMAKNILNLFDARIGISTTGFSLPYYRKEDKEKGHLEINVVNPYAWIGLYDKQTGFEKTIRLEFIYDKEASDKIQRVSLQAKVAKKAKKIYYEYCKMMYSKMNTY